VERIGADIDGSDAHQASAALSAIILISIPAYIMAPITPRYDLLRKRAERFTRLLHEVEHGDVRAIHRTRVASRRLREVLPVLRLDTGTTDWLNRRLRKVTERLGPVRELDVLAATIEELRLSGR
jgi:hypothetical protein